MPNHKYNRDLFVKKLKNNSIAIIPGAKEAPESRHPFHQYSNFFWLTGFDEPSAIAVILKQSSDCYQFILFCQENNKIKEKWTGKIIGLERAIIEYDAHDAFAITELDKTINNLLININKIYLPLDQTDLLIYIINKLKLSEKTSFKDSNLILEQLRLIKTPEEILLLNRASLISAVAHRDVMKSCKPGQSEAQIAGLFKYTCSIYQSSMQSYPVIAASGDNACTLHYEKNTDILKNGDLLLLDAGCEFRNHSSDVTRTIPISGKFSKIQGLVYEIVLTAQKYTIEQIKPGATFKQLELTACKTLLYGLWGGLNIISKQELDNILAQSENSIINNPILRSFYPHSIGHFVGRDVHDSNNLYKYKNHKFSEDMVITIEPGLYFDSDDQQIPAELRGIGIRIEDTILITAHGCKILSGTAPKEISDIEELMNNNKQHLLTPRHSTIPDGFDYPKPHGYQEHPGYKQSPLSSYQSINYNNYCNKKENLTEISVRPRSSTTIAGLD